MNKIVKWVIGIVVAGAAVFGVFYLVHRKRGSAATDTTNGSQAVQPPPPAPAPANPVTKQLDAVGQLLSTPGVNGLVGGLVSTAGGALQGLLGGLNL